MPTFNKPTRLSVDYVDAFTEKLFAGNPAAVIFLDNWLDESLMQSIASENNLSETAFAIPLDHGWHLRWFSPLKEIPFCGHATLASAFILFKNNPHFERVSFYADAVGWFDVFKLLDNRLQMHFPNRMPERIEHIPEPLVKGLSQKVCEVYKNEQAWYAVLENEAAVRNVEVSAERLKLLAPLDIAVTASSSEYDFISRYFWPASGGLEDPVTGSIHTALVPLWAKKLNKRVLIAYQASERGGILHCSVEGNRVLIAGQAVHYLTGTLLINH